MHQIIRDEVRPAIRTAEDGYDRRSYIHSAVSLTQIAATVGDSIARLRGGNAEPESRQRITVERIQRLSNDRGEGG